MLGCLIHTTIKSQKRGEAEGRHRTNLAITDCGNEAIPGGGPPAQGGMT